MESVSPMWGLISSTGMPRTSAICCDTEERVPPMSGEPSVKLILPSGWTRATALEGPVLLPQKPLAMPDPGRGLPGAQSNGDGLWPLPGFQ